MNVCRDFLSLFTRFSADKYVAKFADKAYYWGQNVSSGKSLKKTLCGINVIFIRRG
jgi:hypothetical protein